MNTKFLSTVAAIALLSGPAFAQTSEPSTEAEPDATTVAPEVGDAESSEGDAAMPAEGETETDAAEADAEMPADGASEPDAAESDAEIPVDGAAESDAAESDAEMPADSEGETDAAEGEAEMPAEGEAVGADAETDAAMPADAGADTDAAEGEAEMPAEGEAETDAAEGDAAMPAEGEADSDVATEESAEDERMAMYGAFADVPVSDVVGMNVLSADGDDIGEVNDLIRDGDAVMAIVGVGGFLGLGEHEVALPLADFAMGEDALQLGAMTQEDLEALPEYAGEAESLSLDTTVAGEPIAADELMSDPAAAPSGG